MLSYNIFTFYPAFVDEANFIHFDNVGLNIHDFLLKTSNENNCWKLNTDTSIKRDVFLSNYWLISLVTISLNENSILDYCGIMKKFSSWKRLNNIILITNQDHVCKIKFRLSMHLK